MTRFFQTIAMLALTCTSICADTDDGHVGPVTDIVISGEKLFSCSQGGIFEGLGDQMKLRQRPNFRVLALAASPELLFAGGEPGVSGNIGWSQGTREIAADLIYSIAASPDARHAAVACADGDILICSTIDDPAKADWKVRHRHTSAARAVAFSPDGKWLASVGLDGAVIISAVGGVQPPQHLDGHTAGIDCLTFSPDSKLIASGSRDSKVRIHQVDGKLLRTYTELGMADEPIASRVSARVLSIAWGSSQLVVGTSKGTVHELSLVDDRSSKFEREYTTPITALAFDPGKKRLIIADYSITIRSSPVKEAIPRGPR